MPGGEPSVTDEELETTPSEHSGERHSSHRTEEQVHENPSETSFVSDRTPANYSFDPVLSSTPAGALRDTTPMDSVTASNASADMSFPSFTGSSGEKLFDINLSLPDNSGEPPSSASGPSESYAYPSTTSHTAMKIKGKAAETTNSLSISNIFPSSPSPKKSKSSRKSELRLNVLRQNLRQAITPNRPPLPPNPFQSSSAKVPWDGIVDLAHYSSTTSDSSISFGLSPELKMKYFSTPQYKLMRSTTEEAVAIRMAETKARLPSESSQDGSLPLPPTPMSAAKRAQQLREIRDRHSKISGGRYRSNLLRDDDGGGEGGEFFDDDSSLDSDDYASTSVPHRPSYGGGMNDDLDSDSDSDFAFDGNESGIAPPTHHSYSNSDSGSSSDHKEDDGDEDEDDGSAQRHVQPRQGVDDDTSQVSFDHTATGPTETIFGARPGVQISAAQFERNLGKPLNARLLPSLNTLDSPTPGVGVATATGRRPKEPSNPRKAT